MESSAHRPTFRIRRWLRNADFQTIAPVLPLWAPARRWERLKTSHIRFAIPGGDLRGRAYWGEGTRPAALLLHGIGGTSESHYMLRAGVALVEEGYHVVRLNLRGVGDGVSKAPSLYHAGLTSDVFAALQALDADPRTSAAVVLGFSGGGGVALKALADYQSDMPAKLRAVATVSAPLDFIEVARNMERLRTFPYRAWVLRNLVTQARAFAALHPSRATFTERDLATARSFRDFDGRVMVPMHGFRDVVDYWERASAGPHLGRIGVPTLVMHAKDDPMVPFASVKPWMDRASSAVHFEPTLHGGHLGWVNRFEEAEWVRSWTVRRALDFFAANVPA